MQVLRLEARLNQDYRVEDCFLNDAVSDPSVVQRNKMNIYTSKAGKVSGQNYFAKASKLLRDKYNILRAESRVN